MRDAVRGGQLRRRPHQHPRRYGRQLTHPVDTGFLVFNRRTYPNLCAVRAAAGRGVETEMSFGVSLAEPELEWAGTDLASVFAQRSNLVRPAFLAMLRHPALQPRDHAHGWRGRHADPCRSASISTWRGYSQAFPTGTCCRWPRRSGPARRARCWPTRSPPSCSSATTTACWILDRPTWMTVKGGGRSYAPHARLRGRAGECASAARDARAPTVWVAPRPGHRRVFDELVLACPQRPGPGHPRREATPEAPSWSGPYQANVAYLHTDRAAAAPAKVWSAWNYLAGRAPG